MIPTLFGVIVHFDGATYLHRPDGTFLFLKNGC